MAEKKYANNEKIICPYCGRSGTVMLSHGDLAVIHKRAWVSVIGSSGKKIEYESLVDGCSKFGKMGTTCTEL